MKLATLRLLQFGPFTNLELPLDRQNAGFQLLYGRNEAGKSSALRAIQQLFYGIDRQSKDNFLHPNPSLRLGATLVNDRGESLEFIRRKADKASLRLADDQALLPEEVLQRWLQGVDKPTFETMFGIDHVRLRAGGQEIISGKGQLAQTLFAAAAGIANLSQIAAELQKDYEQIYIQKGRNQRVPELLRELTNARKQLADLQLSSETWRSTDEELRRKETERGQLLEQLKATAVQQERSTRFRTALPLLSRWRDAEAMLTALADVPTVRTGFAEDCRRCLAEIEKRTVAIEDIQLDLTHKQTTWDAGTEILLPDVVVDLIDSFRERLGSHRKAQKDRPQVERELKDALSQIDALRVQPTDREPLSASSSAHLRELASMQSALQEKRDSSRAAAESAQSLFEQLDSQQQTQNTVPDTAVLGQTLKRLRQAGDLEAERDNLLLDGRRYEDQLATRLSQLRGWQGSVQELSWWSIPSEDTRQQLEKSWNSIEERSQKLLLEQEQLQKQLATLTDKLRKLDSGGNVPTADDLLTRRTVRDQTWDDVRLRWSRQDAYDADVATSLSHAIRQADDIADQIHQEAKNVAQKQNWTADLKQKEQDLDAITQQQQQLDRDRAAWADQQRAAWSGLNPHPASPTEGDRWLEQRQEVLDAADEVERHRVRVTQIEQQISRSRSDLVAAWPAEAAPLDTATTLQVLLTRAEVELDRWEQAHRNQVQQREQLEASQTAWKQAQAAANDAAVAWQTWLTDWTDCVAALGLAADVSATEALAVADALAQHQQLQKEVSNLQRRIAGIDEDAQQFAADVLQACQQYLPAAVDAKLPDDQVASLEKWLQSQQSAREQRSTLQRDLAELQRKYDSRREALQQAEAELKTLGTEIGHNDPSRLAELLPRLEQRRQAEEQRAGLQQQLAESSGGLTIAEFLDELSAIDSDTLAGELTELNRQQETCQQQLSELDQSIGQLKQTLQQMRGEGAAAEQANNCQFLVTELQEACRDYAVQRLAAAVLQRGIDRYRDRHQGPLLSRAGDLFGRLTCGAFAGLQSEIDGKNEPILVGVRANGVKVKVEEMSDGTSDQLYLALRLAGLETWLDDHEPLPFIVDDILLHFDDDRAAATLDILGELSRRTQVLFFTHHHRLVELAEKVISKDQLAVHRLGE